jgi:hypothetical protein
MLDRSKIEILQRIYVGFCLVGSLIALIALAFGWVTASYWAFIVVLLSFAGLSALALVGILAGIVILFIRDAVRFVLYGKY